MQAELFLRSTTATARTTSAPYLDIHGLRNSHSLEPHVQVPVAARVRGMTEKSLQSVLPLFQTVFSSKKTPTCFLHRTFGHDAPCITRLVDRNMCASNSCASQYVDEYNVPACTSLTVRSNYRPFKYHLLRHPLSRLETHSEPSCCNNTGQSILPH